MSNFSCSECGIKLLFTNKDSLCVDCRREKGLPPYNFLGVHIRPFVKDSESSETIIDMNGEEGTYTWISGSTGFEMVATVEAWGFATIEFWIDDEGNWHCDDDCLPDDFLAEAFKYWSSQLRFD